LFCCGSGIVYTNNINNKKDKQNRNLGLSTNGVIKMDLSIYQDSKGRISSSKLKANNITSEELYLLYHNITKPLCKNCNKEVKYMGFKRGYNETCSVKCANKIREIKADKIYDTESFIKKAKEVHGDLYDYSETVYTKAHDNLIIICKEHGKFSQRPHNHINGRHCEKCSYTDRNKTIGWSRERYKNIPTILYYIKLKKEKLYKIGVTSRSVKERFTKDEYKNIEIISEEIFQDGRDAFDKELKILQDNKDKKYKGKPILESGNSELFISSII